jgi:hypothetical protein
MQECGRRSVEHTPVAIRGACHHTLEQRQHAAHALDFIERSDEVHLRRPRIGEAHIHPPANQRAHQAFCTIHGVLTPSSCMLFPVAHAQAHAHSRRGIVSKSGGEHKTMTGRARQKAAAGAVAHPSPCKINAAQKKGFG